MKKILLLSCILILMPLSAFAATISVPGDQPSIQAGIDAAVDGDIVLLADGTFTGVGNYNIDFKGKSITIKSANGPDNCIIDCQGLGRGFLAYNGETVTLDGLTIENADAGDNNGGGVYANSSEIIIADCVFDNNSSGGGGAVYCSSSSTFSNCTFRNNTGEQSSQTVTINVNNDSPIANAGPDQIVPGNSVQLDGSGSYDPDGSIVSWSWILEHLDNSAYDKTATGETPTVSNLEYGNYTVTLTVTDNHGATGTDEMHLSVAAAPTYQEGDECPGWWLVP